MTVNLACARAADPARDIMPALVCAGAGAEKHGRGLRSVGKALDMHGAVRPWDELGGGMRGRKQGLGGGWYMPKRGPCNPITRRSPSPDGITSSPVGQGGHGGWQGRRRRAHSGGGDAPSPSGRCPPPLRESHSESVMRR